jgi:hypothetical protein
MNAIPALPVTLFPPYAASFSMELEVDLTPRLG